MCETMKTLMKDEMMEVQREGEGVGEARGEMKKAKETAYKLAIMKFPVEKIAKVVKGASEMVRRGLSEKPSAAR